MSLHESKPETSSNETIIDVDSLDVEYSTKRGAVKALRNVSIQIREGETLGIAGESGSGKSTLALAILRYLGENGAVTGGDVRFEGESILELSKRELRSIRGNRIAHVPQDPKQSLNPSIRVGEQIAETVRLHQDVSKEESRTRAVETLKRVNISEPEYNAERYPHELSGGMQQRVLFAMALSCDPDLLVLDEPTTGLDVTTQAKILDLITELKESSGASVLLITHNLAVISEISDRVGILYAGEIMERGAVDVVFENPSNPYTRGLLGALPDVEQDQRLTPIPGKIGSLVDVPSGCIFADRCEFADEQCRQNDIEMETVPTGTDHQSRCRRWETVVDSPIHHESDTQRNVERGEKLIEARDVKKHYGGTTFFESLFASQPSVKAVDGVDLDIHESEVVGLVGESGCGKSTLGRTLLQLLDLTEGTITYRGQDVSSMADEDFRSEVQIVFQNPESSLNPQKTVYAEIERPLRLFTGMDDEQRKERVLELLNQVGLGAEYASRYPHELSGGEKQRVAIARAFAPNPSFVVLDEPVSALDVSVQASVLNLLATLREEYDTSYLLISHDLSVVRYICDRIAVMYLGHVVETGTRQEVFEPPHHPYTQALLSSIPSIESGKRRTRFNISGDVPSARNPPQGCAFHSRCPKKIGEICENERPKLEGTKAGDDSHRISCHLDEDAMCESLQQD